MYPEFNDPTRALEEVTEPCVDARIPSGTYAGSTGRHFTMTHVTIGASALALDYPAYPAHEEPNEVEFRPTKPANHPHGPQRLGKGGKPKRW